MLNELAAEISQIARDHGFDEHDQNPLYVALKLALIHSEVSEALEADRIGDSHNLEEELADIIIRTLNLTDWLECIIRVLNLTHWLGCDIDLAVRQKIEGNRTRKYKHGGKRY